jgi:ATP-dependent exoDNAse (exonuclease V) beta subunit
MAYLRISDLAGSSGCVPYLSSKFRRGGGGRSGGYKPFFPPTFSQELGTAVHELIQYVLEKPPEERRQVAEEMERDLVLLRTTQKTSALLNEALPDRFLESGLRVDKIMETWRHGERLLDLCIHFLAELERTYEGSENKWRVDIEVKIHQNTLPEYQHAPPSSRYIVDRDVPLHGSVDLVFRWSNVRIMGELKTGNTGVEKKKTWKDQVAIYADIWREKHPEHEVHGYVFHARHKPIPVRFEYPFSELSDFDRRVGGPQCSDCSQKLSCEKSKFTYQRSHF